MSFGLSAISTTNRVLIDDVTHPSMVLSSTVENTGFYLADGLYYNASFRSKTFDDFYNQLELTKPVKYGQSILVGVGVPGGNTVATMTPSSVGFVNHSVASSTYSYNLSAVGNGAKRVVIGSRKTLGTPTGWGLALYAADGTPRYLSSEGIICPVYNQLVSIPNNLADGYGIASVNLSASVFERYFVIDNVGYSYGGGYSGVGGGVFVCFQDNANINIISKVGSSVKVVIVEIRYG